MLKHFILLSIISITALSDCFSQNIDGRSFLSVSAGPSFPIGNFSNTDSGNELAGFAKTGEEVTISYTRKLNQHFGIVATLLGQRNGLNTKSLKQQFSRTKFVDPNTSFSAGNINPADPSQLPEPHYNYVYYSNWNIEKHTWLSGSLLLGGSGIFPVQDSKLTFIIKGMAGVIYISSPKIEASDFTKEEASNIINTSKIDIEQSSESAFGFSYLAYGGVNYQAGKRIYLLLGINYLGTAKIRFPEVTSKIKAFHSSEPSSHPDLNTSPISVSSSENVITASTKQTIQTIGLNLGIALEL